MTAPTTSTPAGRVTGLERHGTSVFKGIPYATATRFQPPSRLPAWDGTHDATRYREQCPQLTGALERLLGASKLPTSEDCHFLNVFTPGADRERRPVLVWVHGGAFVTGGGAMPWYDGSSLARRGDVVVVTLNYRLGAFGFTGTGNHGLADVVTALEWVRECIGSFGGDPENVTIFGESAGGAAVVAMSAVPAARDLYARTWAMSPSIPQLRDTTRALEAEAQLRAAAGVSTGDRLRDLPVDDLLAAQGALLADRAGALTAFSPTPDGRLIPGDILDDAAADHRPLVIGSTRDEMHIFTAFDPSMGELDTASLQRRFERCFGPFAEDAIEVYRDRRPGDSNGQLVSAMQTDETFRVPARCLADRRVQAARPTWMYWFTHPTPAFGGLLGACHGLDIPYAFHNLGRPGVEMFTGDGAEREAVADEFAGALLRFAREGHPAWPEYDGARTTREIAASSADLADPEPEIREMWERITVGAT
jgi:para-nitrobenzyl esterase